MRHVIQVINTSHQFYEVEASSREEALDMVFRGDAGFPIIDTWIGPKQFYVSENVRINP